MEPAHDFTFFCFFFAVFLATEDRREGESSVDATGISGVKPIGEEGSETRD